MKRSTSYAVVFLISHRILEQGTKSSHYVALLRPALFQTAIEAGLACETSKLCHVFYLNNQFACTACDGWTTKYVSKTIGLH